MIKIIYLLKVLATFLTDYVRNSINAKQDVTLARIHTSENKRSQALVIIHQDRDDAIQAVYDSAQRSKERVNDEAVKTKTKALKDARVLSKKLQALESL